MMLIPLLLILLRQGQADQCSDYLTYLIQHYHEPAAAYNLTQIIWNSGIKANDLGDYDGCNIQKDKKYALWTFKSVSKFSFNIGYCVPKICNDTDLQTFGDTLAQMYSTFGMQSATNFFTYPKEIIDGWDYDAGFGIMVTIISLLILFGLIGIYVEYTSFGNKPDWQPKVQNQDMTEEQVDRFKDNQLLESKEKWAIFFLSFSFMRNLRKLLLTKGEYDSNLKILNGIRVMSMCWVILGHSYSAFPSISLNTSTYTQLFKKFMWTIIGAGPYSVDTFFFLSGFLASLLLLEKMYPKKGNINFGQIYLHRYIRLVPSVLFLIGIFQFVYQYWGNGPLWPSIIESQKDLCSKYW